MTPIRLSRPMPPVLAVGAFLKNTVCGIRGDTALLSPTIGDLDSREAIDKFEAAVDAMMRWLGAPPMLVTHDLHPDFHSTRWAHACAWPALAVQHHHAHAAAIAAEHHHEGPLLGLSLDGFGLGPGNESWGGELLLVDGATYTRIGHLARLAQPGGDAAAREPWRMAAAALHRMGRGDDIAARFPEIGPAARLRVILDKRLNSPPTSSCGRLFDAACGLLGIHPIAAFEGQAPMALEKLVTAPVVLAGGWSITDGVLDFLPLLERLIATEPAAGADLFHGTLIAGMTEWVAAAAKRHGVTAVALGGGCFFNKVLADGLVEALGRRGLTPLTARLASPGDPGLSLGQAWIAALTVEAMR